MNTFLRTEVFDVWLSALKDKIGRARITHRIRSAEHGNFGDCEPVGDGVFEMRVHVGPGYRVYYTRRGQVIYLLLLGGDKSTQKRDIKRAIEMARELDVPIWFDFAHTWGRSRRHPDELRYLTPYLRPFTALPGESRREGW